MTSQRPLRVGIVGASLEGFSWGAVAHIPALHALARFEPAAIATTRQETADRAAQGLGIGRAFGDWRAMVADRGIDAVAVCVRVPAHHDIVAAALAAGKHVYCEWPLDVTAQAAADLAAQAEKAGTIAMVGLQSRAIPAVEQARAMVADGAIGRLLGASLTVSSTWPTTITPSLAYLHQHGTGASFLSITTGHAIDAVRFILGAFAALSGAIAIRSPAMTCVGDDGRETPMTRASPDQVALAGLVAGAPVTLRSHGGPAAGAGFRLEINGSSDTIVLTGAPSYGFQMGTLDLARLDPGTGAAVPIEPAEEVLPPETRDLQGPPAAVAAMYARFAEAIDGGRPVPATFADAVLLHRLLEAVQQPRHAAAVL